MFKGLRNKTASVPSTAVPSPTLLPSNQPPPQSHSTTHQQPLQQQLSNPLQSSANQALSQTDHPQINRNPNSNAPSFLAPNNLPQSKQDDEFDDEFGGFDESSLFGLDVDTIASQYSSNNSSNQQSVNQINLNTETLVTTTPSMGTGNMSSTAQQPKKLFAKLSNRGIPQSNPVQPSIPSIQTPIMARNTSQNAMPNSQGPLPPNSSLPKPNYRNSFPPQQVTLSNSSVSSTSSAMKQSEPPSKPQQQPIMKPLFGNLRASSHTKSAPSASTHQDTPYQPQPKPSMPQPSNISSQTTLHQSPQRQTIPSSSQHRVNSPQQYSKQQSAILQPGAQLQNQTSDARNKLLKFQFQPTTKTTTSTTSPKPYSSSSSITTNAKPTFSAPQSKQTSSPHASIQKSMPQQAASNATLTRQVSDPLFSDTSDTAFHEALNQQEEPACTTTVEKKIGKRLPGPAGELPDNQANSSPSHPQTTPRKHVQTLHQKNPAAQVSAANQTPPTNTQISQNSHGPECVNTSKNTSHLQQPPLS
ncbi:hypothetical protein BCR33DRAFT_357414 [Rhizoclosmatium globosum]|uniref:Uncharacterized protein n=1 Tax=Rhizoclosmatium globosum TaxID=329046 RepID=A0A1Y2C122_9FUNG|nr:hypothetical protein BCR33DRAFT_357414 [Rhizoclosmatium globosum]|eukprot:ORY40720.1 hypothetical protein BCR33DRAFT_357414 [Rhizoclosmatium globosum]